jgi:outer membrane protein OmpA-like peptidoglycan-associated protein
MKTQIMSMVAASIIFGGCTVVGYKSVEPSNIDHQDLIKESALHDAVRANDIKRVQLLVKNKSNVNLKDTYGYTPLHIAVRLNQIEIATYLIKNGAEVNSIDYFKDTPLLDSTRDDYTDMSKLLLCNGASPDVEDKYSMKPLHYSSKNSNDIISQMILADNLEPFCKSQVSKIEKKAKLVKEKVVVSEETAVKKDLPLAQSPEFKGLYEALQEEFKDNFGPWQAELTKDDLLFRFNNPAAIFNVGDSSLKKGFTDILTDFFPRYLKVLSGYNDKIQEVRIEGHTSSEYSKAKNDQQRYELNKQLSEKRAITVRDYAVNSTAGKPDVDSVWVESTFKPYGMSYDNLIYNPDGTENKIASRRVDFKIIKKER